MSPDTVLKIGAAVLFLAITLVGIVVSETRTAPIEPARPRPGAREDTDPDTAYEEPDYTHHDYRAGAATWTR